MGHSADTNLGKRQCAHEPIVMDKRGSEDYTGAWEVNQALTAGRISHYWPVWAVFHVDRDGAEQRPRGSD